MAITNAKTRADATGSAATASITNSQCKAVREPHLYATIFIVWVAALIWFHPRFVRLLDIADGPVAWSGLLYFVLFTEVAWLYGIYNLSIVAFSGFLRWRGKDTQVATTQLSQLRIPVAVLYTCCNDFVEASALSCVNLRYEDHAVYILDDSTDADTIARVDAFAAHHTDKVRVIRRGHRRGFKAGNLNHALSCVVRETYFVIADADELLPSDFLTRLVPRLTRDPRCGFIQANHRCLGADTALKHDMRAGVDIHWKWYQPLRNRFGFVMLLGHGALLRRSCWEQVGGFPELVSEDLAYALALREHGYYGSFAEDVICFEEFPESVRAFRVRHVKWTRGSCELLHRWGLRLLATGRIPLVEKVDVLFPTLNLPLTLFFFVFMADVGLLLPAIIGETRELTVRLGNRDLLVPIVTLPDAFRQVFTLDFYAVTVMTILAPVMCFIVEMRKTPLKLFRFLCHSTALYAALSPLSSICVLGYMLTGQAKFLVTGDKNEYARRRATGGMVQRIKSFLRETHPDHWLIRTFEITVAIAFLTAAIAGAHIGFAGLAIAFLLLSVMHTTGWDGPLARYCVWLPFTLILIAILLGGAGVMGLAPVMLFGFGFHF